MTDRGAPEPLAEILARMLQPIVADAVRDALADMREAEPPAGRLLSRRELAQVLGCSLPTLSRLQAEGMPHVRVGDSPRFDRDAVLAWLRERGQR